MPRLFIRLLILCAALAITACAQRRADPLSAETPFVKTGLEVLLEDPKYFDLIRGKRVGLITNPTGVDGKARSNIDLLHARKDTNLVSLFGPEHGVRGDAHAGVKVGDTIDTATMIVVHSLYGKTSRPTEEWLKEIDVLVYDIQDVGATSYTYFITMGKAMEECATHNIPFIVLDRPNPCGADYVDGMVLNTEQYPKLKSGVSFYDMAYMYGLTPGETALMINSEYNEHKASLTVVPMRGYERWMRQWDTGLPFPPASTHIPTASHAFYYSLTGIIGEIRKDISIGVGYTLPFEVIAAPWIDRDELVEAIRAENIPGLTVRPISFKPFYAAYKDEPVEGAHLMISDYRKIRPVTAQIHIMVVLQRLYPEKDFFSDEIAGKSAFGKVCGTPEVRHMIRDGKSAQEIIATFQPRLAEFEKKRAKYLIYD